MDEENWKTIRGTHVLIEGSTGEIKYGPERLRTWGKSKSSAKGKTKPHAVVKPKSYAEAKARCDEIRKKIADDNLEFTDEYALWQAEYSTEVDGLDFYRRKLKEMESNPDKYGDKYETRMEIIKEQLEETGARVKDLEDKKPKVFKEYDEAAKELNEATLREFPTADDCKTSKDVTDYLRAKGYFRKDNESLFDSDNRVDLALMGTENAKGIAEALDKLMTDYPKLVGKLGGIDCRDMSRNPEFSNTYAHTTGNAISFNMTYYGEGKSVANIYANDVRSGFHPKGTDWKSVVDHEFTHAIEKLIERKIRKEDKIANIVMQRAMKRVDGKYDRNEENYVRHQISRYAAINDGIRCASVNGQMKEVENEPYGRNTEFLAEAMVEARQSQNPSKYAIATRKEFEKLMKEADLL